MRGLVNELFSGENDFLSGPVPWYTNHCQTTNTTGIVGLARHCSLQDTKNVGDLSRYGNEPIGNGTGSIRTIKSTHARAISITIIRLVTIRARYYT